jgi:hypothetical protein
MTTTTRARVGGEVAPNGEFYKGGQFINTVEENSKKGSLPRTARKVEVEPYKWEADRDGEFPIFAIVGTVAAYIDRYKPAAGITPYANGVAYYGNDYKSHDVTDLCERYNAGERWATC